MIISHEHKFIFLHIPKCGGSSVTGRIISEMGYKQDLSDADPLKFLVFKIEKKWGNSTDLHQHAKFNALEDYFKKNSLDINEYFKFSFVRNPWERAVSEFAYAKKMSQRGRKEDAWAEQFKDMTFLRFVSRYKDIQLEWLEDSSGKMRMDFVGKTRALKNSTDYILDYIKNKNADKVKQWMSLIEGGPERNLSKNMEIINKCSENLNYRKFYNENTKQIIARKCKKDIDFFNFKF